MVVYAVRCGVEPEVADAFGAWLADHLHDVCACDGFVGAMTMREEEPASAAEVVFTTWYRVRDQAALEVYLEGPAAQMRADGLARFGGRFHASRAIGPVVAEVS